MKLREFAPSDAEIILKWIKNEREFRLWSADRFGDYPATPERVAAHHAVCAESGDFFPLTAVDENGKVVGHLILRYIDSEREEVRFGFVIVDSSLRGRGLGRKMLELAKAYAVETMHAKRLSLGVFENNSAAVKCYKAFGFAEADDGGELFEAFCESWRCIKMEMSVMQ